MEKEEESKITRVNIAKLFDDFKNKFSRTEFLDKEDQARIDSIVNKGDKVFQEVDDLEDSIKKILDKQYSEYVKAFNEFMDTKRKELRAKIEQLEEEKRILEKNNDVRIITVERDFFRTEAVRLNGLCKDMSTKIEEMAFRMKLLSSELNTMTNKWKESENVNKQLLVELESNIQTMKEVEKENLDIKDKYTRVTENLTTGQDTNVQQNKLNDFNELGVINDDSSNRVGVQINEEDKNKYVFMINKLKADLRKERIRNHKTLTEFNKVIMEKNKLEGIFNDCVEEVRKEIFARKLKESISDAGYKRSVSKQGTTNTVTIPYVSDIKYDKFLPQDKRKIMEIFFEKEELSPILQQLIFKTPKRDVENMYNPKVSLLNENRINNPPNNTQFNNMKIERFNKTRDLILKTGFNLTNGFGKKTHLNFGMNKLKYMKTDL